MKKALLSILCFCLVFSCFAEFRIPFKDEAHYKAFLHLVIIYGYSAALNNKSLKQTLADFDKEFDRIWLENFKPEVKS